MRDGPEVYLWVTKSQAVLHFVAGGLHDVKMSTRRRIFEVQRFVHFVTFSCYRRRTLLGHDRICRIVFGNLDKQRTSFRANCHGFVLMPNHVHVLLQFVQAGQLSPFLQQGKQQSSYDANKVIKEFLPSLNRSLPVNNPFWQPRYYDFPIESMAKYLEKVQYIHENPVRAGLDETAVDWRWSSARWSEWRRCVGVDLTTVNSLS